ncbi:MAG: hypothetical protein IPP77_03655 [Bacteroidetes bacterium]|nr:hypothetical protein [Bacteroidota bacterium]
MNKLKTLIAIALLSCGTQAIAGDCVTLAGQFKIGMSDDADYSTVSEAIEALKCGGISGRVNFQIENGVYNEKVVLSSIRGASALNTITFESHSRNNADVVISYATGDFTFMLNSASYFSFENLTIDHKASTYGNCVKVDGSSNNLRFKGVVFEGVEAARTGANNAVIYCTASSPKSDVVFEDCEINNGSMGLFKGGNSPDSRDTRTTITGTLFFNQYEGGLSLSNEEAPVITNNVVSSLTKYGSYKAISFENVSGNLMVSNNIVNAANGSCGLSLNNCVADPSSLGQISNNSIAVGGSSEAFAILLGGVTDNQVINFNRLKLTISGTPGSKQAFYKNAGNGNNVNMLNNILYDLNTGGYTIVGNSYKDSFNQLPAQSNPALTVSANGIMIEKVTPIN